MNTYNFSTQEVESAGVTELKVSLGSYLKDKYQNCFIKGEIDND